MNKKDKGGERRHNKPGAGRPEYKGDPMDKAICHSVSLTPNEKIAIEKKHKSLTAALRTLLPKKK